MEDAIDIAPQAQTEKTDNVENRILNFAKKMKEVKQGTYRVEGETMSVEDAKWNIEAAINYFNVADESVDDIKTTKVEASIDIDPVSDEISLDDVAVLYESLNATATDGSEKFLLIADISVEVKDDGTKALKLTAVQAMPGDVPYTFGEDDYWSYWDLGGYCDGPFDGNANGTGSPDKLKDHVNKYSFGGWKQRTIDVYYTDVEEIHRYAPLSEIYDPQTQDQIYGNPNDPIDGDGYLELLVYWKEGNGIGSEDLCLNPEEMNYYAKEGIPGLITLDQPENKEFMYVSEVIVDYYVEPGFGSYYHSVGIFYGSQSTYISAPIGG